MEEAVKTVSLYWSSGMSVGNELLDSQHQRFLAMLIEIESVSDGWGEGREAVFEKLIQELRAFAQKHIETEEEILRSIAYPYIGQQEDEHQHFIRYLDSVSRTNIEAVGIHQMKSHIMKWWIHHILNVDMAYKPFLSGAKSASKG